VKRVVCIGVVALLGFAASSYAIGWSLIDAKIRRDFPQVKRITTAELDAWLNDPTRPKPLLLDVRTRAEFDVSHLRGATHVEPDAAASVLRESKDRPIVTYCSVGYRSGGFAQKLQAAGHTNVANLEGSIFRWANESRPVFRGAKQVDEVHPYNGTWGLLLKKNFRSAR
jgi:rhodanese-related sulfurtransferase